MPCPKDIQINQCARMSLMLRRAPAASWLNDHWQNEMKKIEECLNCGKCMTKCPYHLNTPELLKKNVDEIRLPFFFIKKKAQMDLMRHV